MGGSVDAVVPPAAVEAVVRAGCADPPAFSPTDARIRLLNLLGRLRELCVAGAPFPGPVTAGSICKLIWRLGVGAVRTAGASAAAAEPA